MTITAQEALVKAVLEYEYMPPELIGSGAIWNPTPSIESSPRQNMLGHNASQFTMIREPQVRRMGSGAEILHQPHTRKIIIPRNCRVVRLLNEQQGSMGNRYRGVPYLEVEYQDNYERDIISLELENYTSDLTFSYTLVPNSIYKNLYPGQVLAGGTILADSPMIVNGEYAFSREANVAYVQLPWVTEDGIGVRRGWVNGFTCTGYGKRSISIPQNTYLLNTYGDDNIYRGFPEQGEALRPDGLLACYRTCDELFDHALMGIEDVKYPDRIIDTPIYGHHNGKVTKIQVQKGNNPIRIKAGQKGLVTQLPTNMAGTLEKYATAKHEGAAAIVKLYENEWREYKHFSNELVSFIADQMEVVAAKVPDRSAGKYNGETALRTPIKSYKSGPLNQWEATIWYEYDIVPSLGTKLTGFHGDKAVVTHIFEDEDAPYTNNGVIVDYTQAPESLPKRTNMGTIFEPFLNAASDTCSWQLRNMYEAGTSVDDMWDKLMDLYEIANPWQYNLTMQEFITDEDRLTLIESDMTNGVYWVSRSDNPKVNPQTMKDLVDAGFAPFYEPLNIRSHSSATDEPDWVPTHMPVMVGKKSIMMLEKIGSDAGACADIKIQVHGLPAKSGASDRYTTPWVEKALRTTGESEWRHRSGNGDEEAQSEMMAMATDPSLTSIAYDSILRAEDASNPPYLLPEGIDLTNGRGRALIRNVRLCQGIRLVQCEGKD